MLARGYFLAAREAFRVLLEQGRGGSIVFVGSKNALVAGANAAAYSSAKAASLHLARCLAEEGGAHGIRVNTVNPDAVIAGLEHLVVRLEGRAREHLRVAEDELQAFYRGRTKLGVNVFPEDVAEAIGFFAGPALGEVHGQRRQRRRRRHRRLPAMTARQRRLPRRSKSFHRRKRPLAQHDRKTGIGQSAHALLVGDRGGRRRGGSVGASAATHLKSGPDVLLHPEGHAESVRGDRRPRRQARADRARRTSRSSRPARRTPRPPSSRRSRLRSSPNAAGIVIAGNDPDAVCPALKQAMAKGIAVVAFDSDTNCRQLFINQADTETIGRSQIQLLAKQMGYKGQFAILSAASTATNQNAWIDYMKLELKKPAYKNMKLVKIYYGNDNPAQSLQATESMLQAYPNLKGIESPTTVGISSAAQYLSTSKYKGKVVLTGLGLPSQMKKYVLNGTVKKFALWNPEDLGYLAGYAVAAIASGDITGKVGETFKAGKLGTYKIIHGPDGRPQVILGPPFVFNKSNVAKFNF